MNSNTSSSNSQELSSASLSASAVLGSHTLSSESSSASTSLDIIGISVPDREPSDGNIFKRVQKIVDELWSELFLPLSSAIESDENPPDKSEIRDNRQVLADVLLEYAGFCKSSELGLDLDDADLLRVKAENLRKCGTDYIRFDCLKAGCKHTFMLGQHCKSRACPDCSSYKRRDWLDKYLPHLEKIDPSELRFMTLTLRNQEDLHGGMGRIIKHFKKLRLREMAECFNGGLVGYEAHLGDDGCWNIHCHVLYHGNYIDQAKLSKTWKKITGDSEVVWVSSVLGKGYKCQYRDKRISAQQSALDYILKYVVKGVGANVDVDSWSGVSIKDDEDWNQVGIGTALSPFELKNEARSAGDARWTVESLSQFLVYLHKSRLLQPFGEFIGKSCKHEKNQLACPECDTEFFSLTIEHSETEIFNALHMLHPHVAHLLSGGRVKRFREGSESTKRKNEHDPVGGTGSKYIRALLDGYEKSSVNLGGAVCLETDLETSQLLLTLELAG